MMKAETTRSLRGPLALAITCFVIWGLAYGLLDVLNKHFQETLNVSKAQSSWLQIAYFGAYLVWSIPLVCYCRPRDSNSAWCRA